jgi:hypothetical protein
MHIMKPLILPALLLFTASSYLFGASLVQSFYDRVKPENRRLYQKVRTGEEWKNPFLVATAHGIVVNRNVKAISPKDIVSYLLSLPSESWPYGRIVALSQIPIQDATSSPIIDEYLAQAQKELKTIQIKVLIWPSN